VLKEDEAHPSSPGMGAMAAFAQASHRFTSFASAKEAVNATQQTVAERQSSGARKKKQAAARIRVVSAQGLLPMFRSSTDIATAPQQGRPDTSNPYVKCSVRDSNGDVIAVRSPLL